MNEEWIGVLPMGELREHRSTRVMRGEEPVMLYRDAERIYAIGNRCAHQGAPLDRGPVRISGSLATVTCQVHGSMFRLDDGSVARGPALAPVPAYEVRVTDGIVELRPRA